MFQPNKRRAVRRPMDQGAAILKADGKFICECTLTDVSADGARLKLAQKPDAPAIGIDRHFILSLSKRGNVVRHCELVWQKGPEIGARFTEAKRR